jgi:hypothetical protein
MKRTKLAFCTTAIAAALLTVIFCEPVSGQPTAAQLKALEPKKDIVSFTWHHPGTREWSSTYKKYVWSIYWTAKRKTDQPGVTLTVKGYSSFDIVGGKYVYWRDFVGSNSYDGQKPPPLAEINETIQKESLREFTQHLQVGEYESLKMAANPDWEWHTMNSVSFTVVAVYQARDSGGGYTGDPQLPAKPSGKEAVDRIEAQLRLRLYRDSPTVPWRAVGVSDRVPVDESRRSIHTVKKFLGRRFVDFLAARELPGPTRLPVLTQ